MPGSMAGQAIFAGVFFSFGKKLAKASLTG
jgi:hypothetical protein